MKQSFTVPVYDWKVTVYYAIGKAGAKEAADELEKAGCRGETLETAKANLNKAAPDTGFAYSNYATRCSVLVIHKATSIGEFINTLSHEKNHLEMHICEASDINPYSEEAAHLSGDLAQAILEEALCSIVTL